MLETIKCDVLRHHKNVSNFFTLRRTVRETIAAKVSNFLTAVTFCGTLIYMTRVLTDEEKEIAYEYAIQGLSLSKTAKVLGFPNDMAFHRYMTKDPLFSKELHATRAQACDHLEDKMLEIPDSCSDPKVGRVQLECYARVLSYRNPQRYGNRIDHNITGTVDIGSSIARMHDRLAAIYPVIDVTPKKLNDINDLL